MIIKHRERYVHTVFDPSIRVIRLRRRLLLTTLVYAVAVLLLVYLIWDQARVLGILRTQLYQTAERLNSELAINDQLRQACPLHRERLVNNQEER